MCYLIMYKEERKIIQQINEIRYIKAGGERDCYLEKKKIEISFRIQNYFGIPNLGVTRNFFF